MGVRQEAQIGIKGGQLWENTRVVVEAESEGESMEVQAMGEGALGGAAGEERGEGVDEVDGEAAEAEQGEGVESMVEAAFGGEGLDGGYEEAEGGRCSRRFLLRLK